MMNRYCVFKDLKATTYNRHPLHTEVYDWAEKNCYVDLMIEILHVQGLEPLAMLPFALALDFEGDQWTFFKPQLSELRMLYGLNVQELSVWRPLLDHAQEHLGASRLISVEADAYWLPDTSGSDYRRHHVKTTIALADLDVANQRLRYFHNAGYYELADEDFRQLFRLDQPYQPDYLPLYAELIHLNRVVRREQAELVNLSVGLLRQYVGLRPQDNPILRFAERFTRELPMMQAQGLPYYHAWAFNNIRQLGAAFELAAAHLAWLEQSGISGLTPARLSFTEISGSNKGLILKVARAVRSGRALDLTDLFDGMARAWTQGMTCLDAFVQSEDCGEMPLNVWTNNGHQSSHHHAPRHHQQLAQKPMLPFGRGQLIKAKSIS
jgi:hypothetical protein